MHIDTKAYIQPVRHWTRFCAATMCVIRSKNKNQAHRLKLSHGSQQDAAREGSTGEVIYVQSLSSTSPFTSKRNRKFLNSITRPHQGKSLLPTSLLPDAGLPISGQQNVIPPGKQLHTKLMHLDLKVKRYESEFYCIPLNYTGKLLGNCPI